MADINDGTDLYIDSPFFLQWGPTSDQQEIYNLSHLTLQQREEFLDLFDKIISDNDFSHPLPDYKVFYRIPSEYTALFNERKKLYQTRLNKLKLLEPTLSCLVKNGIFEGSDDVVVVKGTPTKPADLIQNVINRYDYEVVKKSDEPFMVRMLYNFAKTIDYFRLFTNDDIPDKNTYHLGKRQEFLQEQLKILDNRFFEHKLLSYYSSQFTAPVHPMNNNTEYNDTDGPNFTEYFLLQQYIAQLAMDINDSNPSYRDAFQLERMSRSIATNTISAMALRGDTPEDDVFFNPGKLPAAKGTDIRPPSPATMKNITGQGRNGRSFKHFTSLTAPPPIQSTSVVNQQQQEQYQHEYYSEPVSSPTAAWHNPEWVNNKILPKNRYPTTEDRRRYVDIESFNQIARHIPKEPVSEQDQFVSYLKRHNLFDKQLPQSEIEHYYRLFYEEKDQIDQSADQQRNYMQYEDFESKFENLYHSKSLQTLPPPPKKPIIANSFKLEPSYDDVYQDTHQNEIYTTHIDTNINNDTDNEDDYTDNGYYYGENTDNGDDNDDSYETYQNQNNNDNIKSSPTTMIKNPVLSTITLLAPVLTSDDTAKINQQINLQKGLDPNQTVDSTNQASRIDQLQGFFNQAEANIIAKRHQNKTIEQINEEKKELLHVLKEIKFPIEQLKNHPRELTYDEIVDIKKNYINYLKSGDIERLGHYDLPLDTPFINNIPYKLNDAQTATYNEFVYMLSKYHPSTKEFIEKIQQYDPSSKGLLGHDIADIFTPQYQRDMEQFLETHRQLYGVSKWSQVRTGFLAKHPYLIHLLELFNGKEEFEFYVKKQQNRITHELLDLWDKQHVIGTRHIYTKDDDLVFGRAVYYFENKKRYEYIQAYNEWEVDAKNEIRLKLELGIRYEKHLQDTRDRLQHRADLTSAKYGKYGVDKEGKPKHPKQLQQWANRGYVHGEGKTRYPPNEDMMHNIKLKDADYLYNKYVQNEYEDSLLSKGYDGEPSTSDLQNGMSIEESQFVQQQRYNIINDVPLDELVTKYVLESLPQHARLHPPIRSAVLNNNTTEMQPNGLKKPQDIYEALLFNPLAPKYGDGLKLDTFVDVNNRVKEHKYPIYELIHDDTLTAEDIKKRKEYDLWLEGQKSNSKDRDLRKLYQHSEYYYGGLQDKLINTLQDRRLRQHNMLLSVLTPKQYDEFLEYKGYSLYPKLKVHNNNDNDKNVNYKTKTISSDGKVNFNDPRFTSIGPPPSIDYTDEYQNQDEINKRFGYAQIELKTPLTSNFQVYAQVKRFQFEKNKMFDEAEEYVKSQIDLYGADINQKSIRSNIINQQNVFEFIENGVVQENTALNKEQHHQHDPKTIVKDVSLAPAYSPKMGEFIPIKHVPEAPTYHHGSYMNDIQQIFDMISQSNQDDQNNNNNQNNNKKQKKKKNSKKTSQIDEAYDYLGWSREQFTPHAYTKFVKYRTEQLLKQWITTNLTKKDLKHFSEQDRSDLRHDFTKKAKMEANRIWGEQMFVPESESTLIDGASGFINDDEIEGRVLALSNQIEQAYYPGLPMVNDADVKKFTENVLNPKDDTKSSQIDPLKQPNGYLHQIDSTLNTTTTDIEEKLEVLPFKPRFRLDRAPGDDEYAISTGIRQLDAEYQPLQETYKIKRLIQQEMIRRARNVRRKLFVQHLSETFPLQFNGDVIYQQLLKENKDNIHYIPHYLSPEKLSTDHEEQMLLFPQKLKHYRLYEYKRRLHDNPIEYSRLISNYIRNLKSLEDRRSLTKEFLYILHPEITPKASYCNYINNLAPRDWHVNMEQQHFYENHIYEYVLFLQNEQNNILQRFNQIFYTTDDYNNHDDNTIQTDFDQDWHINENNEFIVESNDFSEHLQNIILDRLFNISPNNIDNIPQDFKNLMYLPQELNQSPYLSWICDRTDELYSKDVFIKQFLDQKTHINYPLIQYKRNYLLYHYYTTNYNTSYQLVKKLLIQPLGMLLKYGLFEPLTFLNKPIGLVQKESQEFFDQILFPTIHFSSNTTIRSFAPYLAPLLTNYNDYLTTMSLYAHHQSSSQEYGANLLDTISYRQEGLKWLNYRNVRYGNNGQILLDNDVDLSNPELKNKLFSTIEKLFLISPQIVGNLPSLHTLKYTTILRDENRGISNFPEPTRLFYNPYDMSIIADTRKKLKTKEDLARLLDIPSAGYSTFGLAHNIQGYSAHSQSTTAGTGTNTPWQNPDLLDLDVSSNGVNLTQIYEDEITDKIHNDLTNDILERPSKSPHPQSYFSYLYKPGELINIDRLNEIEQLRLYTELEQGIVEISEYTDVFGQVDATQFVIRYPFSELPEPFDSNPYIDGSEASIKVHIPLSIYTNLDEFDPHNILPEENSIDACFEHWVIHEREKQYHKINDFAIEKTRGFKNDLLINDPNRQVLPALPLKLTLHDLTKHREENLQYELHQKRQNMLKFIHKNYITRKNYKKYNLLKFKDNEEIVDVIGNEIIIRSKNMLQRSFDSHQGGVDEQRELFFAWLDWLKKDHRHKIDRYFVQKQRIHTQLFVDDRTGEVVEKPLTSKQLYEYDKYQQRRFNSPTSSIDRVDALLNPEVHYQKSFSPVLHDYKRQKEYDEQVKIYYINQQRDKLLNKYKNVNFDRYIPNQYTQASSKQHQQKNKNKNKKGHDDITTLIIGPHNTATKVIQLSSRQKYLKQQHQQQQHNRNNNNSIITTNERNSHISAVSLLDEHDFIINPKSLSLLPSPVNFNGDDDDDDDDDSYYNGNDDYFSEVDKLGEYSHTPQNYRISDNTDFTFSTKFNPYKPAVSKDSNDLTTGFHFGTTPLKDLPETYFTQASSPSQHFELYQQSVLSGQYEANDIVMRMKDHQTTLNMLKQLVPNHEYRKYLKQYKEQKDFEKHQQLMANHSDNSNSKNFFNKIWPFGSKKLYKTEFYEDTKDIDIFKQSSSQQSSSSNQSSTKPFTDWFDTSNTLMDDDTRQFIKEANDAASAQSQISPEQRHLLERLISRLYDRVEELNDPNSKPIVMNPDLDVLERQTQLPEVTLSFQAFRNRYTRKLTQQHKLRSLLNMSVDNYGDFNSGRIELFDYLDPNIKSYDLIDLDDYSSYLDTPYYNETYQPALSNDPAMLTKQMANYLIFSGNTNMLIDCSNNDGSILDLLSSSQGDNGDDQHDYTLQTDSSGNYIVDVRQYMDLKLKRKKVLPQSAKNRDLHWYQRFYMKLFNDKKDNELKDDQQNNNNNNNSNRLKNDIDIYSSEEKELLFNNQFENSLDLNPSNDITNLEYQTPYIFHKVKQLLTNDDRQQYFRHIAYKMDTLSLDIYQFEQMRLDGQFGYHPIYDQKLQKRENNIHLLTEDEILNKNRLFLKYYYPDGTQRYNEDKMPHITAKQREENHITLMKVKYKQYQKMMVFLQHDLITLEDYNQWCVDNYYNHNDEWFTYLRVYHILLTLPMIYCIGKGIWSVLSTTLWNPVRNTERLLHKHFPIGEIMKYYVLPILTTEQIKKRIHFDDDNFDQNNDNNNLNHLQLSTPNTNINDNTFPLHQLTQLASSFTQQDQQGQDRSQNDLSNNNTTPQQQLENNDDFTTHQAFSSTLDLFQSPFFDNKLTKPYHLPHLYQVLLLFATLDTVNDVITMFNDVYPYLQHYYGDIFTKGDENDEMSQQQHIERDIERQIWLNWFLLITSPQHSPDKYHHIVEQLTSQVEQNIVNQQSNNNYNNNNHQQNNNNGNDDIIVHNFHTIHLQLLQCYDNNFNRHTNDYIKQQHIHLFTAWVQLENVINCLISILPYQSSSSSSLSSSRSTTTTQQSSSSSLLTKQQLLNKLLFEYQPILSLFVLPYDLFSIDNYQSLDDHHDDDYYYYGGHNNNNNNTTTTTNMYDKTYILITQYNSFMSPIYHQYQSLITNYYHTILKSYHIVTNYFHQQDLYDRDILNNQIIPQISRLVNSINKNVVNVGIQHVGQYINTINHSLRELYDNKDRQEEVIDYLIQTKQHLQEIILNSYHQQIVPTKDLIITTCQDTYQNYIIPILNDDAHIGDSLREYKEMFINMCSSLYGQYFE